MKNVFDEKQEYWANLTTTHHCEWKIALHVVQSQNLPAIIYEQVDKLKLVEAASQFCSKNEHRFSIKE